MSGGILFFGFGASSPAPADAGVTVCKCARVSGVTLLGFCPRLTCLSPEQHLLFFFKLFGPVIPMCCHVSLIELFVPFLRH